MLEAVPFAAPTPVCASAAAALLLPLDFFFFFFLSDFAGGELFAACLASSGAAPFLAAVEAFESAESAADRVAVAVDAPFDADDDAEAEAEVEVCADDFALPLLPLPAASCWCKYATSS